MQVEDEMRRTGKVRSFEERRWHWPETSQRLDPSAIHIGSEYKCGKKERYSKEVLYSEFKVRIFPNLEVQGIVQRPQL